MCQNFEAWQFVLKLFESVNCFRQLPAFFIHFLLWKPFQAGTYIGDEHKQYFSGDAALKAGGKDNTMNQFEVKVEKDMLERQI